MELKKTLSKFRYPLIGVLAATVFLSGYAYSQKFPHLDVANAQVAGTMVSMKGAALADFTEIAAQQGPAVVNVSVSGHTKTGFNAFPELPQIDPNDPFQEFFKRFQGSSPNAAIPKHGLGSGFIVASDGVVLTNAHVVADADEVTVKLTDKREFKAKVIGSDKLSDVAVLKIDAANLPTVRIGNAKSCQVGEWVVAIGSPFGFENTVTAGILSGKSRTLPDEGYVPFLQTDVAINPGNSGGPLFNMRGEVIGINSQIYSNSGGYQGLSFAIPIDVAMKVEHQLIEKGRVSRGRLGISIRDVNSDLASSLGMEKPLGALINAVEVGGPADQAGIDAGDVVLKFDGVSIDRSSDLPPLVSEMAPGTKAALTVLRQGKAKDLTVTVGEMKNNLAMAKQSKSEPAKLGIVVRPLTERERKEAGIVSGLVVERVGDGLAQEAGIQSGDVLISINGELVSSVEQLQSKVGKAEGTLSVLVLRENSRLFVPIQLG